MEEVLTDEQKKEMDVYMKELEKKEAIRKGKSVSFNIGMEGAGFGTGQGGGHLLPQKG
jgi:hypothetical protein